jgi:CRISPR/Cas system-associated exonuclease Cas4 (RecB family)
VAELVLSASSAEAYMKCGWRWYLEYVEQVPTEGSVRMAVGLAVHEAIEAYYRFRLDGLDHDDIVLFDEVLAGLVDVHDSRLAMELAAIPDPDEDVKKARREGGRVLISYIEDVGAVTNPLYVEEQLRTDINGIPYSVHIDLIDDRFVVRDTKVKRQKPRDPGIYAFAMNGYSLNARVLLGRKETDVQLDIMIRLKRDRPYHVPIRNGGPVTDAAAGIFASQLEYVANGIEKGRFQPTGLETGACRWCPVKAHCIPYQETQSNAQ